MTPNATLGDFRDEPQDADVEGRTRPECAAAGCSTPASSYQLLCVDCRAHKHIGPRTDLVEWGEAVSPELPRCGYCGLIVRPVDDPRRCRACALLEPEEVVSA